MVYSEFDPKILQEESTQFKEFLNVFLFKSQYKKKSIQKKYL